MSDQWMAVAFVVGIGVGRLLRHLEMRYDKRRAVVDRSKGWPPMPKPLPPPPPPPDPRQNYNRRFPDPDPIIMDKS